MTRFAQLAAAATALSFALHGCGGGGSGSEPGAEPGSTPPAAVAPSITSGPASQTVTAAQRVTFSASASGGSTLSWQWQRNGADILGATQSSYTHVAQLAESGSAFRVRVSNAGGSATSDAATLTVLPARPGAMTLAAGTVGGAGNLDGMGAAARFNAPGDVAIDAAGNIFVADTSNGLIRRITPDGSVTTIAGAAGRWRQGGAPAAAGAFGHPVALARDGAGSLYVVAGYTGHLPTIWKVGADGSVITFFGTAPDGSQVGSGMVGNLGALNGIAIDAAGNVYVTDGPRNSVFKITPERAITKLAGADDSSGGLVDGAGSAARFKEPQAMAVDRAGSVYVTDNGGAVRKISPAGVVSTLLAAQPGLLAGGIAVDDAGNVLVGIGCAILRITPSAAVSTLAGVRDQCGAVDGLAQSARFGAPQGLVPDGRGGVVVADANSNTVRRVDAAGTMTTIAGAAGRAFDADGPYGLYQAVDAEGNVFVVATTGRPQAQLALLKITPAGVQTPLATGVLLDPRGIAVDAQGNVYVADLGPTSCIRGQPLCGAGVVRKFSPQGTMTILAGSFDNVSHADGTGAQAGLIRPGDVALDATGNLYVAEELPGPGAIRRITPDGVVTTVATGIGANSLALDAAGNIYASVCTFDPIASVTPSAMMVVKIRPDGASSVLAGTSAALSGSSNDVIGSADGSGAATRFSCPRGVAVDRSGRVLVADSGNNTVRQISPAGQVTTVVGQPDLLGIRTGPLPGSLTSPTDLNLDAAGRLYIGTPDAILKVQFDD